MTPNRTAWARALATAAVFSTLGTAPALATPPSPIPTSANPLPRSLTPAEAARIAGEPIVAEPSRAAPPGPVRTAAEYEPAEGIMFSWEGSSGWLSIIAQMVREITTTGEAKAFIMVGSTSERTQASSTIAAAGADMSRVEFTVRRTDSIWIRDYGPRYIYLGVRPDGSGGVRAVVDHTYNRPRPNDNALPDFWAQVRGEPTFQIPLVHGGGNYHLEASLGGEDFGRAPAHATRLIVNENPSMSQAQIIDAWRTYQNLDTTLYTPYPASVDSTQHIDMWIIPADENTVLVSQWVNEPNSSWAITSNNAAAAFAARGYTVVRVPAVRSGGTHYTFTNAVICNDLVLVPSYTNSTASLHNAAAIAAWQQALPGKTIRPINCQAIVTSAGVMHCIAMHVPAPAGGDNPTAYITSLNNAPVLDPGTLQGVEWLADGPNPAVSADILLSTDGGQSYPITLATDLNPVDGLFAWFVPDIATDRARLRLVVRDAQGNEGFDDTDQDFTIAGEATCPADLAPPFGELNFFDLLAYFNLFNAGDPAANLAEPIGTLNFFDLTTYLTGFNSGCP